MTIIKVDFCKQCICGKMVYVAEDIRFRMMPGRDNNPFNPLQDNQNTLLFCSTECVMKWREKHYAKENEV